AASASGDHQIVSHQPSPDGRYDLVCYAYKESDLLTIQVMDVEHGKALAETIHRSDHASNLVWSPDSSGFYHTRFDEARLGKERLDPYRGGRVAYHELGTPTDADGDPVFRSRGN